MTIELSKLPLGNIYSILLNQIDSLLGCGGIRISETLRVTEMKKYGIHRITFKTPTYSFDIDKGKSVFVYSVKEESQTGFNVKFQCHSNKIAIETIYKAFMEVHVHLKNRPDALVNDPTFW